ncbi:hypothetical protein QO010_002469 [Caulobacter ginsengisoli]|uniref:Uncharacterized protein n=1 Tax=Caulobacter ginsengisoli TaxID=400775 RepID=A0ABU0ITD4_9CAUL|nr:hypothetical protein [Caulobacter ginsengisoli]MDQ0464685.1 hypothetical protein [Caulobacter ginsengisoli]
MKSILKSRLPIALVLCLLGGAALAQDDGWITVKAGNAFTFEAPADIQLLPVKSEDGFFGHYESARFGFDFEYGLYAAGMDYLRSKPGYDAEDTVIDGRKAVIFTGPIEGVENCTFETSAYVWVEPEKRPGLKLAINACSNGYAGVVQLHRLFKSLRFIEPSR